MVLTMVRFPPSTKKVLFSENVVLRNPKCNYSPALQQDKMELVYVLQKIQGTMIFGTTVRNKRHAELKMVRVRIGWEVTRGGLRPT